MSKKSLVILTAAASVCTVLSAHAQIVQPTPGVPGDYVLPDGSAPASSQWSLLDQLTEWGIPVAPHRKRCATIDEVAAWAHTVEHETRAELGFAIDGVRDSRQVFRLAQKLRGRAYPADYRLG